MKVRTEIADLLVVSIQRCVERKPVRVGIHPDNKDFGTQVQECNSALDNTIYYWFSESEFAEVQEHLGDENKGVYFLEETHNCSRLMVYSEYTLILGVSDNNEPFEIKEKVSK